MWTLFKIFRRLVFPALLVLSLLFNGLLLVSTTIFNVASAAIGAVSGVDGPAKRHADEVSRLTADLDQQKRINRELRSETAELGAEVAAVRAARKQTRDAVTDVSQRVATRTTKAAARETAAMAGEAIPVWGTAVIVTATALELNDFCQTMKDMTELQVLFDPDLAVPEEELAVCGMEVPSRSELWETVSTAPGDAWASASAAMPTMSDVSDFELPDIDWTAIGASIGSTASNVSDATVDAMSNKWGQLKDWWSEEE